MEKMRMESADLTAKNVEKIGTMFPNCITESKDENGNPKKVVNFDLLRQMLSEDILEGDEAYEFTWVGKKAAIVEANKPIRKTLRPCKEESVDWDTTENLYIEGDNLEVLKLLQESYLGKVKMIYIDPPYNTGNDFIYNDDFKVSGEEYADEVGEHDDDGNRMFKNTDTNGRFHSDWCSMIYSRLMLARNLLTDDGIIFISMDDHEYENLKKCCDELFGRENYIATFIWEKRLNRENRKEVSNRHDYILCFSKHKNECERTLGLLPMNEKALANYGNPDNDPRGLWKSDPAHAQAGHGTKSQFYTLTAPNGKKHELPSGRCWLYTEKVMNEAIKDNRIWFGKDGNGVPRIKTYLNAKERGLTPESILFAKDVSTNEKAKNDLKNLFNGMAVFDTPKPTELIEFFLRVGTKKDDIVLDFFSGSSTTAHSVLSINSKDNTCRKYIMIQLPEACDEASEAFKNGFSNICEIGKERIRRAGAKIKEENPIGTQDLDTGFRVLKLDDSNMNDVYYGVNDYDQGMLSMLESNIKEDRTDLDLLFGCLLEWGLPLSLPYTTENINGFTIHNYNDGDLIACFDEGVSDDIIKEIAKKQPLRAVFRDSSFPDSPAKINVGEIFKMLAPKTSVKVI